MHDGGPREMSLLGGKTYRSEMKAFIGEIQHLGHCMEAAEKHQDLTDNLTHIS